MQLSSTCFNSRVSSSNPWAALSKEVLLNNIPLRLPLPISLKKKDYERTQQTISIIINYTYNLHQIVLSPVPVCNSLRVPWYSVCDGWRLWYQKLWVCCWRVVVLFILHLTCLGWIVLIVSLFLYRLLPSILGIPPSQEHHKRNIPVYMIQKPYPLPLS